jgi:DNA-binding transcriptional MerR regulator/trans-aconitate methyltransferase
VTLLKDKTYYTTGEFAKKANVSLRTIRYYDKQGILKPTHINESGYRLYTDYDFAKLQRILALKYLGFTLEEIMDITINDNDHDYIKQSFQLQLQLVKKKIEHLQLVEQSIQETSKIFEDKNELHWNNIINLIHLTNMEKSLVEQYRNAANINIRIQLHKKYSTNPIGWFQWIFSQLNLKAEEKVLEVGCGNGELWKANENIIPKSSELLLSDISIGMVNDARENLKDCCNSISFEAFDCHNIPAEDETFHIVIANHVVFYLKDREKALNEIKRVLKKGGYFYCSTYGKEHMKEIDALVKEFDARIALSEVSLYEVFGLENGMDELIKYFNVVEVLSYDDFLMVDNEAPLIDYILSCHGNQHEYLKDRYSEFKEFLKSKLKKNGAIKITKRAGIFRCRA